MPSFKDPWEHSDEPASSKRMWLCTKAHETIRNVMLVAESSDKHTPGSWVKEGFEHHVDHATEHIIEVSKDFIMGGVTGAGREKELIREDLTHALTRIAMALWSLDNEVLGDNGPEGVNAK